MSIHSAVNAGEVAGVLKGLLLMTSTRNTPYAPLLLWVECGTPTRCSNLIPSVAPLLLLLFLPPPCSLLADNLDTRHGGLSLPSSNLRDGPLTKLKAGKMDSNACSDLIPIFKRSSNIFSVMSAFFLFLCENCIRQCSRMSSVLELDMELGSVLGLWVLWVLWVLLGGKESDTRSSKGCFNEEISPRVDLS